MRQKGYKVKEGLEGRDALAIKLSSAQIHEAAGQLHAIAGQIHTPVGWFSYGGTTRVMLAVVLAAVAAGVAGAGLRLRVQVRLPRPGRTAATVMLATWVSAIVAFVVCLSIYVHQLVQEHVVHSRPSEPILPVTVVCMIALFFGILYIGRSLSQNAQLGSAVIGAIAAPMIFEFPFDLMVMTRTYPPFLPIRRCTGCSSSRRCSLSNSPRWRSWRCLRWCGYPKWPSSPSR